MGRRVLESLRGDKLTMLLAARYKWSDNIDVTEWLIENGNEFEKDYNIEVLHGSASFHQGGLNDNNGLDKENIYVDLGDDPLEMPKKGLQDWI